MSLDITVTGYGDYDSGTDLHDYLWIVVTDLSTAEALDTGANPRYRGIGWWAPLIYFNPEGGSELGYAEHAHWIEFERGFDSVFYIRNDAGWRGIRYDLEPGIEVRFIVF